jgi:hypothetical protein
MFINCGSGDEGLEAGHRGVEVGRMTMSTRYSFRAAYQHS